MSFQACGTAVVLLMSMRCVRNLLDPPLGLTVDTHKPEDVYRTNTLQGTNVSHLDFLGKKEVAKRICFRFYQYLPMMETHVIEYQVKATPLKVTMVQEVTR